MAAVIGYCMLRFSGWLTVLIGGVLVVGGVLGVWWTHSVKVMLARFELPFCIHCGYSLRGLPADRRCPECGTENTSHLSKAYRENPEATQDAVSRKEWNRTQRALKEHEARLRKQRGDS